MPAATPLTSATTGVRDPSSARTRSAPANRVPWVAPSADSGAPEQNPRPAPVSATTRTAGSASKARTASATAAHICGSTAFSRSGALSVIRPTAPAVSTRTVVTALVLMPPSNRTTGRRRRATRLHRPTTASHDGRSAARAPSRAVSPPPPGPTVRPAALVTTPVTADLLRGAVEVEPTLRGALPHRLTAAARRQNTDPGLALAESQPSGVRLVVRTRATVVELEAHATRRAYVGAPPPQPGVYDLLVDRQPAAQGSVSGGSTLSIDMTTGATTLLEGDPGTVRFDALPDRDKTIEIWLPHTEVTEVIALRTDAPVEPAPASDRPVWVHHGSSISHGSNAASPSTTWPAVAARLGGVDLVNLGFGGGALLDPFTARAIRDIPADLLSVKVGINVVNLDAMRLRDLHPGGPRLPRHHPRGPPHHPAPRGDSAALPDPRGHPRPGPPRCRRHGRGPGALPRDG